MIAAAADGTIVYEHIAGGGDGDSDEEDQSAPAPQAAKQIQSKQSTKDFVEWTTSRLNIMVGTAIKHKVHISNAGRRNGITKDSKVILVCEEIMKHDKFKGCVVTSSAVQKRFERLWSDIPIKYDLEGSGANLSGLPATAPQYESLICTAFIQMKSTETVKNDKKSKEKRRELNMKTHENAGIIYQTGSSHHQKPPLSSPNGSTPVVATTPQSATHTAAAAPSSLPPAVFSTPGPSTPGARRRSVSSSTSSASEHDDFVQMLQAIQDPPEIIAMQLEKEKFELKRKADLHELEVEERRAAMQLRAAESRQAIATAEAMAAIVQLLKPGGGVPIGGGAGGVAAAAAAEQNDNV